MTFVFGSVALILFVLNIIQVIETLDLRKEVELLEKENSENDIDYYKHSQYIETLEMNVAIRGKTIEDLKHEVVNLKADNYMLSDRIDIAEHEALVAAEAQKNEEKLLDEAVFYDKVNDVMIAGTDLEVMGKF